MKSESSAPEKPGGDSEEKEEVEEEGQEVEEEEHHGALVGMHGEIPPPSFPSSPHPLDLHL